MHHNVDNLLGSEELVAMRAGEVPRLFQPAKCAAVPALMAS